MASPDLTIRLGARWTGQQAFGAALAALVTLGKQGKAAKDALERTQTAANALSAGVQGLLSPLRLLGGVVRPLVGGLGNLAAVALSAAGALGGALFSAVERVVGALSRIAAGATLAATAALTALGKAGVEMNVTFDRSQTALTRIGGSAQGAARLLHRLKEESLTSALTFKEMLPLAQQLAAVYTAAYGPSGLGRVIPTMRAFGDAASTLGIDVEGQKRALLGFRQLVGADKPRMQEIRQISENLPGLNVLDILKRSFGTADTKALGEMGVLGKQAAEAILKGMQQGFGGAQAQAAGTLPIILSNFQDAFNNLAAAVTARFTPTLTTALGKVLSLVQRLSQNARVIRALSLPFDLLGRAITNAANRLPALVQGIFRLGQSQGVRSFATAAQTAFRSVQQVAESIGKTILANWNALWQAAAQVLQFATAVFTATLAAFGASFAGLRVDWEGVWKGIRQVTLQAILVLGGSIAGLVNVFRELLAVQQDGRTGLQKLGESMRDFAAAGIRGVSRLVAQVLLLVAAWGAVEVALGVLARNPVMIASGTGRFFAALGAAGFVGQQGERTAQQFEQTDLSKIGQDAQGWFRNAARQPGLFGSFARGYLGFGSQFAGAFGRLPEATPATLPGTPQAFTGNFPPPTGPAPRTPPGVIRQDWAGLPYPQRPGPPPALAGLDVKALAARLKWLQSLLENLAQVAPGQAAQVRQQQLLPTLQALGTKLQQPVPGETPEKRFGRLSQLQEVWGQYLAARQEGMAGVQAGAAAAAAAPKGIYGYGQVPMLRGAGTVPKFGGREFSFEEIQRYLGGTVRKVEPGLREAAQEYWKRRQGVPAPQPTPELPPGGGSGRTLPPKPGYRVVYDELGRPYYQSDPTQAQGGAAGAAGSSTVVNIGEVNISPNDINTPEGRRRLAEFIIQVLEQKVRLQMPGPSARY